MFWRGDWMSRRSTLRARLVTNLGRRRRHPPRLTSSSSRRQSVARGGSVVSAWWCASGHWFGAPSPSSSMVHVVAVANQWCETDSVVSAFLWCEREVESLSGVGHWFGGKENPTDLGEKKKPYVERKQKFHGPAFHHTRISLSSHGPAFHHTRVTGQPAASPSCSPSYLRARLAGLERATG